MHHINARNIDARNISNKSGPRGNNAKKKCYTITLCKAEFMILHSWSVAKPHPSLLSSDVSSLGSNLTKRDNFPVTIQWTETDGSQTQLCPSLQTRVFFFDFQCSVTHVLWQQCVCVCAFSSLNTARHWGPLCCSIENLQHQHNSCSPTKPFHHKKNMLYCI